MSIPDGERDEPQRKKTEPETAEQQLTRLEQYKGELQAGLDLDGAARVQEEIEALKRERAQQQASTDAAKLLAQLMQKKSELEAGLDLDGAAALQPEIDKLKTQVKLEGYGDKTYSDTFTGQFATSMAARRLGLEESYAWADYLNDPSQTNRQRAQEITALVERFQQDNAAVLADDANLPWLSQTLAGYLPQFWDQTKAKAGGALAGGTLAGLVTGGTGTVAGAKAGATAATGVQSYRLMSGQAFKELVAMGVDEETARRAAKDEALLSAAIEMAETGVDMFLGFGRLLKGGTKAVSAAAKPAANKVLSLLGKYLGNLGTEWLEEGSQQAVSIANRENAAQGETGLGRLAGSTGDLLVDILLGRNQEAAREVIAAGNEGSKIAAMMGLLSATGNALVSRVVNSTPLVKTMADSVTPKEPAQETAPNAAQSRTGAPAGEDTTQEQSPEEGAQKRDALMTAMFGQETETTASGTETAVNENGLMALTDKQSTDRDYLGKVPDSVAREVLAETASDGTQPIQTDTMYIRKKKNSQTEDYNAGQGADPAHNVRNVPPQSSSVDIIAEGGTAVNSAKGYGSNLHAPAEAGASPHAVDPMAAEDGRRNTEEKRRIGEKTIENDKEEVYDKLNGMEAESTIDYDQFVRGLTDDQLSDSKVERQGKTQNESGPGPVHTETAENHNGQSTDSDQFFASSYRDRWKQTPSPSNRTVQFEGERGESFCVLKPPPNKEIKKLFDRFGVNGIQYKNAVPDFGPVSLAEVTIDYMVGGKGRRGKQARAINQKQADIKLIEQLNGSPELTQKFEFDGRAITTRQIEEWRRKNKMTWHELNDGRRIQLVPSVINKRFGHFGGIGEINAGLFKTK